MPKQSPEVVVLAGPNGAGKSTSAPRLLQGALKVDEFVNADVIACGLRCGLGLKIHVAAATPLNCSPFLPSAVLSSGDGTKD